MKHLAALALSAAAFFSIASALQSTRVLVELQRAALTAQSQALPPGCVIAYKPVAVEGQPVLLPIRVCDKRHKTT